MVMSRLWESEEEKSWGLSTRGFRDHVATDGSLLGVSGNGVRVDGQWCSWINLEGSVDGLFVPPQKKVIGLTMVHVDNKGIIDGLWKGEMECIGPKAKDADLWIVIREELHKLRSKEILIEVEHVKAHSTEKERQRMTHISIKVMRKRMI